MLRSTSIALICLLCLCPTHGRGQEKGKPAPKPQPNKAQILEVIPEKSSVAIVLRNLAEFRKKGDHFLAQIEQQPTLRISSLFSLAYGYLGLNTGIDENAPAAIVLLDSGQQENGLIVAIPFTDEAKILSNYNLTPKDIKAGKAYVREQKPNSWAINNSIGIRGRHLILGTDPKYVERVLKLKTAAHHTPPDVAKRVNQSDIFLYGSRYGWTPQEWNPVVSVKIDKDNPVEVRMAKELEESLKALEYAMLGVRIDRGIEANGVLLFDSNSKPPLMSRLRAKKPTNVSGLPRKADGQTLNLFGALASRGGGVENTVLARMLMQEFMSDPIFNQKVISQFQIPDIANIFGEVWQRKQSMKSAVYLNHNEAAHGFASVAAVLETNGSKEFLAEMADLADYVNFGGLAKDDKEKFDDKRVNALIQQLASDDFKARRTATTKLRLLGDLAIPYLKKAAVSADAEVKLRARRLVKQIEEITEKRRKDAFDNDLISQLDPRFSYHRQAEKIGDLQVDIVKLRLTDRDKSVKPQLEQLLGPQWDQIRLAAAGNQVAVYLGSDTAIFKQLVSNLQNGRPGLAADAELADFKKRSASPTKIEAHGSIEKTKAIVEQSGRGTGASLSSILLTLKEREIALDLFIPFAELRAIGNNLLW